MKGDSTRRGVVGDAASASEAKDFPWVQSREDDGHRVPLNRLLSVTKHKQGEAREAPVSAP